MTFDEACALLIQQGAELLTARRMYREAAAPLLTDEFADIAIPVEKQIECFRASAELAGVDPDGPECVGERAVFEAMTAEHRLIDQMSKASMN